MQFLTVNKQTKLSELAEMVGSRNVANVLHINNLTRTPNIGAQFIDKCSKAVVDSPDVSYDRKSALINTLTSDSDVFETAALMGSSGWKLLNAANTLPNMLKIPEDIYLPDSAQVLGNREPVKSEVYSKVMDCLKRPPHSVDPSIFNEYSSARAANIIEYNPQSATNSDPMQWFRVPWGEVTLYSSLGDEQIEFPVYPEEMSDSAKANYTTMPDLLYQYEPWYVYNSSGPRSQTYTFEFHRDMWTGDHRDGKANDLIRACMANCYPEYRGSAVYTSTVTLYVAGKPLISGVMTDVNVSWDGPLGLDHFYLHCKLELTIIEVSQEALDYHTVRHKALIG